MVIRSFLDKFNMIMSGSGLNVGISPLAYLYYGNGSSRLLVHFSLSELSKALESKVIPDLSKTRHKLHIFNCDGMFYSEDTPRANKFEFENRAGGFKAILFKLPEPFSSGNGFDYEHPIMGEDLTSTVGCTWYNASTGKKWSTEEGVYSNETLEKELMKFENGEDSVIIGTQDFNIGNENISIDITDYVNNTMMSGGTENNGIGIAFTPEVEAVDCDGVTTFVRFFTHKTGTPLEPFVETTYDDFIKDSRHSFCKSKDNKLYLYCNVGEAMENLDEIPVCKINDELELDVSHVTKGVYMVEVPHDVASGMATGQMCYDTWSNITYHGVHLNDVEMQFLVQPDTITFNLDSLITKKEKYIPTLFGVKDGEKVLRGDVRKICFIARVPYTADESAVVDNMEIRLYIKDGEREFEMLSWQPVNAAANQNYYLLDTAMLPPDTYHIDVRVNTDGEVLTHKDMANFTVVNDITEKLN